MFGKIDSLLSIILIIFCLFISGYLLPKVHIDNLINLNNNFLLSYGIILFSFTGYHSLQIVYDFLNKNKINFIRVNFYSLLFIFLIYLFYVLSTLGFLGSNVEVISLISLINYFQNNYFTYFSLFLFILSILTTFVSLAYYLKRGLIFDFGINEKISWFILGLVLILISFLNVADIIQIINFIGSLFVGLNLILILVCYLKLKDIKYFKIPRFFVYIMIFIFSLGWVIGLIMK
ncbi:MAG: hypothetical protein KatS3mg095_0117 [Candidatus Parcubacteria bacterium]|nr:MAG: hypothetical protein KatS3mg095_0117 [Candidatus Parcubacteria bacterium]